MDCNPRPGERLNIIAGGKTYVSGIQEITAADTLIISTPLFRNVTLHLQVGDSLEVVYYREQALCSFTGGIARVFEKNRLQTAELEIKGPVRKFQRREYARLDTSLAVRLAMLAEPESGASARLQLSYDQTGMRRGDIGQAGDARPFVEGVTANISGGGMLAFMPVQFPAGALTDCTLWLHNGEMFQSQAKVVRAGSSDATELPYALGLQFVNVDETARRRVIKYIFDQQIKSRKPKENPLPDAHNLESVGP